MEALGFFLGAMVDDVGEDEDGVEDDTLSTLSGLRKWSPYLARQRCRGKPQPPMGPEGPLLVRQGRRRVAQRAEERGTACRDHMVDFTQVQAAVRRKTLLLLWWIDGGRMMVGCGTLPGRVCLRAVHMGV